MRICSRNSDLAMKRLASSFLNLLGNKSGTPVFHREWVNLETWIDLKVGRKPLIISLIPLLHQTILNSVIYKKYHPGVNPNSQILARYHQPII